MNLRDTVILLTLSYALPRQVPIFHNIRQEGARQASHLLKTAAASKEEYNPKVLSSVLSGHC